MSKNKQENSDTKNGESNIAFTAAEFIIPHSEAMGLKFVAHVTAAVTDKTLTGDAKFLEALQRAVTNWINGTENGKNAWRRSCSDLNISDLLNEMPLDDSLLSLLADEGIFDLHIDMFGGGSSCWDHDTVLVNENELETIDDDDE